MNMENTKVPNGWELKRLKKCTFTNPQYGANAPAIEYDSNLPRYIRITDIDESGKLKYNGKVSIPKEKTNGYSLDQDDFLFARTGATVGKTYLYDQKDGPAAYAGYLIRFKLNKDILLPYYLFLFTHSTKYKDWVKNELHAGAQPNINAQEYGNLLIPLPPLLEQKKIVEILSTWDLAIERTERLVERKNINRAQTIKKLMSNIKGEETTLGKICTFQSGGTPSTKVDSFWQGTIPWITGGNFKDQRVSETNKYITEEAIKKSTTHLAPKETILLVTRTGVGKITLAEFDIAISQDITAIYPSENFVENQFLFWTLFFSSDRFSNLNQGTSINGILRKDLEQFEIKIPSIIDQKKIANVLTVLDNEIILLKKELIKLKQQKKGLLQKLLSGEVRVKP